MSCSQNRKMICSASLLALRDLDARLAPLNRYGLPGFSSAIAEALRALLNASRSAISGVALNVGVCGRGW
jgi:uncharacterized protein HemX